MSSIRLLADATLPYLTAYFPAPFEITCYHSLQDLKQNLPNQDVLVCRSTQRIDKALLEPHTLSCIATASSGIDHLDENYLTEQRITLFHAKGCNATSVADYVMASVAYLSQQNRLTGMKAGVVGVGEVGSRVTRRLQAAGFKVLGFDPFRKSTPTLPLVEALTDLSSCDLLCIHAALHDTLPHSSRFLLHANYLNLLKPNVSIINASRGGIVDEAALLSLSTPITYCTDVYQNEPSPSKEILAFATLCTPHIAGHSIEAKQNAVLFVSQQLHHYYGLPLTPSPSLTPAATEAIPTQDTWEATLLAFYHPLQETRQLKTTSNPADTFLSTRAAHQTRHDFTGYSTPVLDAHTKSLIFP